MAEQAKHKELKSTGYELFILLLSLVSIADMVLTTFSTCILPDASVAEVVAITDMLLRAPWTWPIRSGRTMP